MMTNSLKELMEIRQFTNRFFNVKENKANGRKYCITGKK